MAVPDVFTTLMPPSVTPLAAAIGEFICNPQCVPSVMSIVMPFSPTSTGM